MLVAQGILPPEVQPPDLQRNPTSTYNSWLNSLPPPLRSAVLSKVPECNIQEQFLKVSGDGPGLRRCWGSLLCTTESSAFTSPRKKCDT